MLAFELVSSKVALHTLSLLELRRRLECLNIQTAEVNRPSTKQLLSNFFWQFFRKA